MQVFIHTAAISRMCLILSLLIPKKERDKWYSKNEYDYNGFLQAEKLSVKQVYKIAGRKFELQRVYDSNYYRICSTLRTE